MDIQLELITACINRERRAEYEMYKKTYSYLMSICIRYTSSEEEAKEALNTGFLKILNNLNKYRPEVPFKRWIRKVMINILIDEYRKEKKHHSHIEYVGEYIETANHSEMNEAFLKINAAQIHAFINKLPPTSKEVFNLYAIDGFSHKEIAEMIGFSEGTSKWHLSFSRQRLKEMITKLVSPGKIYEHE
ncbi:MAG TPA: sigma-70 family RNA polymerase sigma factor [Nitrosopumilaceae archaeon]|jgi:RNA polymerase sigma factor (sigma-70 family)|nr:sigma-70 family RNA polymerase sigma factor [Nitrosopumilaceae archaeon]